MDTNLKDAFCETEMDRIHEFNGTDKDFPNRVTLQNLIEEQIEKLGDRTAVICDHDKCFGAPSLSYAELNKKANQLAHFLRAHGVSPGDVVGIMVERSFSMMIGLLGILKAGAAYLPIPTDNPPERVHYILQNASVRILLTQGATAGKLTFAGRIIDLDAGDFFQEMDGNPAVVNRPDDLAYVIYTSGSTGKPKGVMIEHRSVVNRLHWMQSRYPIGPEDVILQKTPYYFDVSVWELFWWALSGSQVCFLAPGAEKSPVAIVDTIRKHRVSVMHFVPAMLNVFLDYLEARDGKVVQALSSVRQVFASGETLTPRHVRKFNEVIGRLTGAKLTNLYGPTEATVDVTYFDCPAGNDFDKIPIGRPIDNIRLSIIKDGRPAAIGEAGELCIAGVGLARGYLNNPVLTRDKFVDNPINPGERIYRTGDVARWLDDGNVEYLGREDDQIKIRGLRIELGEIESTIRDYPGVAECIVVAKEYSESVILLVAYVVGKPELEIEELKRHLRNNLPPYMVPNHFQRIVEIPLTPSGKADRKALPEPVIYG